MPVTIAQAQKIVQLSIRAREPVLLGGAPGIGKTDIVHAAAATEGHDLIVSYPALSEPTDAKGLPARDGDWGRFLPFGELKKALTATRPTVWLLDDLGQATPAVQASIMHLLLSRQAGEHRLPDCVTFVAATNRRKDNGGVSGLLEPVKSRFATIIDEIEVEVRGWTLWAVQNNVPAEVVAFIHFRPEYLHKFVPSRDLTNSPSPRTWVKLGKLLYAGIDEDILEPVVCGAVGPQAGLEFITFLRMYQALPSAESVLLDPDNAAVDLKLDVQFAVSRQVAELANKGNFSRVTRYAARLAEAGRAEVAAFMLLLSARTHPEVVQTAAYVKAASGDLAQLLTA